MTVQPLTAALPTVPAPRDRPTLVMAVTLAGGIAGLSRLVAVLHACAVAPESLEYTTAGDGTALACLRVALAPQRAATLRAKIERAVVVVDVRVTTSP